MKKEALSPGAKQKNPLRKITGFLCVASSIFYIYTGFFGQFSPIMQMTPMLTIAVVLGFLHYPPRKEKKPWVRATDYLLVLLSISVGIYLVLTEKESTMAIEPPTGIRLISAWVLIFLLVEATRRVMGLPLVCIVIIFLLYAKFGNYAGGFLHHWGFPWDRIADYTSLSTEGIYGLPVYVCSTIIIFFMIFSALLRIGGGGEFFFNFAQALFGKFRGGAAKMAVVGSCLFGMISGSAVANVAAIGTITIPLMKKLGYSPVKAGSIEALASTGGQFMPPVMGAAAFLMAEIIGRTYWQVCVAAFLPALLYYASLFFIVDFEAAKIGLRGLPSDKLSSWKAELRWGWPIILPMIVLVYFMAVVQISPMRACLYALIVLVVVTFFSKRTRLGVRKLYEGLESGMRGMTEVTLACACSGIIIGIMYLTNLGVNLSSALVDLSRGNMLILMLLTAGTSIILGMGMTTSACYLILAILAGPTLAKLGLPLMAAHLFILYFGCLSAITPPVAPASYAAAAVAEAPPIPTGYRASTWGAIAYIVPFFFVYQPTLLLQGGIGEVLEAVITSLAGVIAFAASLQGYLLKEANIPQRLLLGAGGLLLIYPGWVTDLIGAGMVAAVALPQFYFLQKSKAALAFQGTAKDG